MARLPFPNAEYDNPEENLNIQMDGDGIAAQMRKRVTYSLDSEGYIFKHSPQNFNTTYPNSEVMGVSPTALYSNKFSLIKDALSTIKYSN